MLAAIGRKYYLRMVLLYLFLKSYPLFTHLNCFISLSKPIWLNPAQLLQNGLRVKSPQLLVYKVIVSFQHWSFYFRPTERKLKLKHLSHWRGSYFSRRLCHYRLPIHDYKPESNLATTNPLWLLQVPNSDFLAPYPRCVNLYQAFNNAS